MPLQRSHSRSRFAPDVPQEKPIADGRDRELATSAWLASTPPAPELSGLVVNLASSNPAAVDKALDELIQLTMWQEENQRQLAELNAPQLLFHIVKSRIRYGDSKAKDASAQSSEPDQDALVITKALQVLLQLSNVDDLAARISAVPGSVALLTELLSHPHLHIMLFAARCIINLTHSSPESQVQALQAAVLPAAVRLFMCKEVDHARCKLGCQILVNLTSGVENGAAAIVLAQRPAVLRAVALVLDHVHTPEPVVVLGCQLLGNLAQSGSEAQTSLAGCGALHALSSLVEAQNLAPTIYGASLQALSALVLDSPHNTASLLSNKALPPALGALLAARTDPFKGRYEDAAVVLAAHTLIHVLGHMQANGGLGLPFAAGAASTARPMSKAGARPTGSGSLIPSPSATPSSVATVDGPDADLVDGRARVVVAAAPPPELRRKSMSGGGATVAAGGKDKQVVYLALGSAAQAVSVCLPVANGVTGKHGEPVLQPLQVAELRHRMSSVLLPRLRSFNHRTAMTAAASLYHLVAACGGDAAREARALMSDSALLLQLISALGTSDAALIHASLAVLDVLLSEAACAKVVMALGWLPAVTPLLDSPNALVRRWAERALCSTYAAMHS